MKAKLLMCALSVGLLSATAASAQSTMPNNSPGVTNAPAAPNAAGSAISEKPGASMSTGGTAMLSTQDMTAVKQFVMKQKHPSAKIQGNVTVGEALPSNVQIYPVEGSATVQKYRYTIVNDRTVLVDPTSRKVVEIIE